MLAGDGPFGLSGEAVPPALVEALRLRLPVLGIEWGMHAINAAFGGRPPVEVGGHAARHRLFLTMGGKVAQTIGGAGVVAVEGRHRYGLTEARRGHGLMSTAFCVDDGVVEALEVPGGDSWAIGVQWPAHLVDQLPTGFGNLVAEFVARAATREEADTGQPA
jgi:gamma-glutamyl-gamma-aminobutyrate hydrolase PuuD